MEDEERVKFEKESKRKRKSIMGSTETSASSKTSNGQVGLESDVLQAASILFSMRKQRLDPKTANELRNQVMKTNFDIKTGGKLPRLPPVESLKGLIETCSQPFEKELTSSDVSGGQCRLSLTREEVIDSILPMLKLPEENIEDGIPVTIYDSAGKDYQMVFQSWSDSKLYVLKRGWTQFCKDHKLQVQDWVTVWMFRHVHTRNLCFVLTFKRHPTQERVLEKN